MKKIIKLLLAFTLAASVVALYSCEKPDGTQNVDPGNKDNPDTPDNPDNPDTPDNPDEPGLYSFKTIDFNKDDFATWVVWDEKIELKSGFSYILWVCPFDLEHQQRIGNFADVADDGQTCINMLRFGEEHDGAHDMTELQWWCGGSGRVKVWCPGFVTNNWLQLALVCDGTNLKMYLNGELKGEDALASPIETSFGAIEFANSWGKSWRTKYNGTLCQISVYDSALSAEELAGSTLKGLDNALKAKAKAWWPMQEGEGVVCKDEIGNRDIDFSNTVRNDNDGATEHYAFDASELVSWTDQIVELD